MPNELILTPKYKNLKFKSSLEFSRWLKCTTDTTIWFKDKGQDLLEVYVDEFGEVLHSNAWPSLYNGEFVNLETLKEGVAIEISSGNTWRSYKNLVVDFVCRRKE